jgi:hypothetical protein
LALKRYFFIPLLALSLANVQQVFAQYDKEKDATIPLDFFYVKRQNSKRLLSLFHFGLSTGVGFSTFRHSLDGFAIYQPVTGNPIVYDPAQTNLGFVNWFNRVESEPLTIDPNPPNFTVSSADAEIGFKSKSFHIPLRATIHVEFNRFRIGGGYSFEFTKVGEFKPISFGNDIHSFSPDVSTFFLKKYFLLVGASVYRYNEYLLSVDANFGGYGLGKKFDKGAISKKPFINLGITIERELSEYFRLFVRPSYELRSYTLNLAEAGKNIDHKFNALYVNLGVTYRIPELRKCVVKGCMAQINHAHGNKEYRSRRHPVYKKQNPRTGENYPELIKYKGKNKKKLNPY